MELASFLIELIRLDPDENIEFAHRPIDILVSKNFLSHDQFFVRIYTAKSISKVFFFSRIDILL